MAKGILNIQAADGAVIGLHVPDGLTSGERPISLGVNLSGITAYHLLQGNLAVSASTITQGFNTTLYTGNGSTLNVTTGIDMGTQWGNDASEKFGGLVIGKSRNGTVGLYPTWLDSIRGGSSQLFSNGTGAYFTPTNPTTFNNSGITLPSNNELNQNNNYVLWSFQTTHRVTGTTNHGQAYECHYNPFTGFTMVKYTGSGLAGHEIPHMLGRKLGFQTFKSLSGVADWISFLDNGTINCNYISLNVATAQTLVSLNTGGYSTESSMILGNGSLSNATGSTYIMYGWANSYFDEANKLIGNYEIGVYQGTGASGNKITTRGKPAWIMIRRLDSTGDWIIQDNVRPLGYWLRANLSNTEVGIGYFSINSDGFTTNGTAGDAGTINTSGGQYLYMVAYDTNANGGGSYYPLASDTANVQVNNALIPIAQGIDSNGVKNTILSKNETVTGLTYTQGKNYVYYDSTGAYGVSKYAPQYNSYNGFGDYFDVASNKWYSGVSTYSNDGTVNDLTVGNSGLVTLVDGRIKVQHNGVNFPYIYKIIPATVGKKYKAVFTYSKGTNTNANGIFGYLSNVSETIYNYGSPQFTTTSVAGEYIITFVSPESTMKLQIVQNSNVSGEYSFFDNIAVYPIKDDGTPDLSNATEITNGRNYLNHIVYADNDGSPLYVEELPKIEYKDIVKANEFKGKNACTAWVNFDGTTTPPTIRDSYNVSSVVRIDTGYYGVYFKEEMNNTNFSVVSTSSEGTAEYNASASGYFLNKALILTRAPGNTVAYNDSQISVQIFGGKN